MPYRTHIGGAKALSHAPTVTNDTDTPGVQLCPTQYAVSLVYH